MVSYLFVFLNKTYHFFSLALPIKTLLNSLDQALIPFDIFTQRQKPLWVLMHSDELQCNSALLQRCHFADEFGLEELVCNEIDLVHFLKVVVTDGLRFKVVRPSALTSEPFTLLV